MPNTKHRRKRHHRRMSSQKRWILPLLIAVLITLLGYIGMTIFFTSHFLPGTKINGIPFSSKTAPEVASYFHDRMQNYSLTLKGPDGTSAVITGPSISLSYQGQKEIEQVLKAQPAYKWPLYIYLTQHLTVPLPVNYNKEMLRSQLSDFSDSVPQTDAVSAMPEFNGTAFVITPEVYGSKLDMNQFEKVVSEAVATLSPSVDLVKNHCFEVPEYLSDSDKVIKACALMNKYISASVTYQIGSQSEVIDKELIASWLSCSEDMTVHLNHDAVKAYFRDFGKKYDTVKSTRTFTTPTGASAVVSGGTYGWSIDEAAEIDAVISYIKSGKQITKEPEYEQTAASRDEIDWGSTYIEVDLTSQHMWYIKDGDIAFECDVVTGLPTPDRETPTGVYSILERLRNKTLIGAPDPETKEPSYRQLVSYWARVTWTGIGFHDANWQSSFGGQRYKTYGSHGCINMKPSDAAAFYDMISNGTPVVIHK